MKAVCYKCSEPLEFDVLTDISRFSECPKCLTDLRCCLNCTFYDVHSYNDCREPAAERITEKEKANFCNFFKIAEPKKQVTKEEIDPLSAAEALFKK